MPYTFNSTPVYIMNYNTQAGYLTIQWVNNTSGSSVGVDPCTVMGLSTITFKVVTIPPAARKAHSNINMQNYAELSSVFNLK